MDNQTLIKTVNLRREFGDTIAVHDVNLVVPQGAVVALIGQNGAGKTTLLKMIAGLLEPTTGTAIIGALDIRENPRAVHALIGYLPDFFGLYDDLTVEQYLEYFGRAYGLEATKRRKIIGEVLQLVGLGSKRSNSLESLSRGMRQKVAIARTLLHEPPLLLLDEPASGLDPEARHEIQVLFQNLASAGKTLIVSSHILTELEDYCTHVAILHQGALVASGPVDDVRRSLAKSRRVRIRTLEKANLLETLLQTNPNVTELSCSTKECNFSFSGEDGELSALLKSLMAADVPILFFEDLHGTIQDSYLALMEQQSS